MDCPCGVRLIGAGEDALVLEAQQHLATAHAELEYTRAEILFMARPTR
ncbi:hypothetical protein Rhow_005226 [Rhodococcus wratislaviensis]|uniref:DUF1059 domain-containing protein n=1 Tax=Rhodococcus wratislaviensis TaxID=44752 RepID=A0A402CDA4_RHOWR|nr:hypothetical protein Rhow_005226 [Rhodococcus wratislaviensis]